MCYMVARQYAILRFGNMPKLCSVSRKPEPRNAYKSYAYRNMYSVVFSNQSRNDELRSVF